MLIVKLLFLLVGSGAVGGVTYLQSHTGPSSKTVIVSNNHESRVRASLEKQMAIQLLTKKHTLKKDSEKQYITNLKNAKAAFDTAEQELKQAYANWNTSKQELNSTAQSLQEKYQELEQKNASFKDALVTKMAHDLAEETRKLKKIFYEAQQSTYNKEKEALKAKIDSLKSPSTSSDICDKPTTWELKSGLKTSNEQTIENEIKTELTTVCNGVNTNQAEIAKYTAETIDTSDYDNKQKEQNATISNISQLTQKYNATIIDIKSKESVAQSKQLDFKHKQEAYVAAKIRLQKTTNEIEYISEQINTK